VPTEMLSKPEQQVPPMLPSPPSDIQDEELRAATQHQLKRIHRARVNLLIWGLGSIVLTALWVLHEWLANGAFQRFAHEGNPGDWNPTLWALSVLLWGFVVGVMTLRAHFERPPTAADIDHEVEWLPQKIVREETGLRRVARARLERIGRLRFQVAAWLMGIVVLAPLNALIEWQDNGGFQRFSGNSQPGSWDPWILYVGGIWALVIAVFYALPVVLDRRKTTTRTR
jgi:hypothetical protein